MSASDARPSRFVGGERIDAAISELNFEKRKVSLSIKLLEEIMNEKAIKEHSSPLSGKNLPFSSLSEQLDDKKSNKDSEQKLSIVKSDLIKELSRNYPNFLKKDLIKLFDIILDEMHGALKRGERVELRDVFSLEPRIQKARISRNPRTNQKVNTPEKKTILFKMSKQWAEKVNEKV